MILWMKDVRVRSWRLNKVSSGSSVIQVLWIFINSKQINVTLGIYVNSKHILVINFCVLLYIKSQCHHTSVLDWIAFNCLFSFCAKITIYIDSRDRKYIISTCVQSVAYSFFFSSLIVIFFTIVFPISNIGGITIQ